MQRKWKRQWNRMLGKTLAPAAIAATLFFSVYSTGLASPTGGEITGGSGSITSNGATTNITQASDKLAINWQSFNIAKGETVNFLQPGTNAVALNRIIGNNGSTIYGALNANGKVFLINPSGILFAPGSQVNVGGLVASSLNLSDASFFQGKYDFTGTDTTAGVTNQGTLTASNGGYIALLGPQAVNEGIIVANQGSAAIAAGQAATLDFTGDGLINLKISQAAINAQAANHNLIQADGGLVVMTARAAGEVTGTVVNNTGIIKATGLAEKDGKIILDGGNSGLVKVSGTLDATGQTGGTVKVLGDNITLATGARIDVSGDNGGGTALIGGAYQGGSSEKTASTTTVEEGVTISADALKQGNGGQVVVWADDATKFAGIITARGGAAGGNGGSVETSGKKTLQVADTASVNTLAPKGKSGNWLLDPADFTIAASGGDITGATLSSNLNTGNVTILSSNGTVNTSGSGDIHINDAVSWTNDNTLTLQAERDIVMTNKTFTYNGSDASSLTLQAGRSIALTDAVIQSASSALNVTMSAGLSNPGTISLNKNTTGSKILSNGGDIRLGGAVSGGVLGVLNGDPAATAIMLSNAELVSGSGKIELKSAGGQTSIALEDSKLTTTTGDIWLEGTSSQGGAISKGITIEGGTRENMAVTTQGGNITIKGSSGGGTGADNSGLWISKALFQTSGSGNVTLEGAGGEGTVLVSGTGNYSKNRGIFLSGALVQTVDGAVSLTGTGAAALAVGTQNYGVALNGSSLKTTGSGTIGIVGTGGSGGTMQANNFGVVLNGTGSVETNSGSIAITGHGGGGLTDRRGLYSEMVTISSGTGDITLTGTTSYGEALSNYSQITTGGDITMAGLLQPGGSGGQLTSGNQPLQGKNITITAAGNVLLSNSTITAAGDVSIKALAGKLALTSSAIEASGNADISLHAAQRVDVSGSQLQTDNGSISLTGTGMSDLGYGIWLYDSTLRSTGDGNIALTGTGGSAANYNFGVAIDKGPTRGSVTTNRGSITITGTGSESGADRRGIYSSPGTTISSTSGNIVLSGTSSGYGVTSYGTVSTEGTGTISLTGLAVNGVGGAVYSLGPLTTKKQAISITADGNILLRGNINAGTTSGSTGGGIITLQSNGGTVTDTTGISIAADGLVLKGAGASYTLNKANYSIGLLAADTGSITFKQNGGISIDTVGSTQGITATGPVTIETPSPDSGSAFLYINKPITITSGTPTTLTLISGNNLVLNQGSAITAGNAAVNVVMASNSSGNGGFVKLLQNSSVTTNGGSLTIGGGANGTGYAVAADPYNDEGVWIATSTINTGAGDIVVRGKGYSGVRINGGSLTTTSGSITLDGIGDATGGSNPDQTGGTGVFIKSYTGDGTLQPTVTAVIQTDTGNITITGTSNNSGTESIGSQNYFTGVNIFSDSRDLSEATAYKGAYITSRNGDISITGHRAAGDTSTAGNAGISTSALTRIETTGSGNIYLSNDSGGSTPANETGLILTGDVTASGSGNVNLHGNEGLALAGGNITAANGHIYMYATGDATQVDSSTNLSSGTINGNLLLDGGAAYTLTSSQNAVRTLAGSARGLKLVSGTPLTVGTVNSTSGLSVLEDLFLTVAAEGGLLTIDAPVTRHYSSHTFGLTADRMKINAQVDQGQTNATWAKIAPYTAGWGIHLGSDTDTAANALEISAAEYARIGIITGGGGADSRNIQYGDANTGAIQISQYMRNNSADNQYRPGLRLVSGSTVTESGMGAVEANELDVSANGAITLTGANKVYYFTGVSNNHDIKLYDALASDEGLTIQKGINAGTGNLTLQVDGASVNLDSRTGFIIANGLELLGPSTQFWLYDQGLGGYVRINTLAGDVGSAAIYVDKSFDIGQVGTTLGLTAHGVPAAAYGKRALGIESAGTITQSQAIQALDLYLGAGNFELTNANNHVEKITTYSYNNDSNSSANNISYRDRGDLVVNTAFENMYAAGNLKLQAGSISVPDGSADNNGAGIIAGGDVTLVAEQDINLGSSLVSTGGNILAAAGGNFLNNTSSNTGLVATAGRYLVYSSNPDDTIEGMTGYNEHYNQTYTAGVTPSYAATGNWFLYRSNPSNSGNEQVDTAIKHSQTKTPTPGNTAQTSGNGSGSVPITIHQGGMNLGSTVPASSPAPSTVQVSGPNGQAAGYSVNMTGQSMTLTLTGAPGGDSKMASGTGTLAVLTVSEGQGAQTMGHYSVTSASGSLTLSPVGTTNQALPPEPGPNAAAAIFRLNAAGGAEAEFKVVYADNALSIQPVNEAAAAMVQTGGENGQLVVATGILTAQQELGAGVQSVEAVYLH